MDVICTVLLVAFGLFAGFFIGCGNRRGLLLAVAVGVITGLLLDLPFFKGGDVLSLWLLFSGAVVGSIVALYVPADFGLKRWARRYPNLRIRLGDSYKLGGE